MMRHDLPEGAGKRSSHSPDNGGQCVERQITADGLVAVGDSKNRGLGAHLFRPEQWQAFVDAVKSRPTGGWTA